MTSFELRLLARQSGWPERVQRGIQTAMAMVRVGEFFKLGKVSPNFVDLAAIDQALEQTKARLQV